MLPCQNQCASYHEGCHKTCAWWSAFQEQQRARRQAKKAYLKYYGDLCADTLRRLAAMQSPPAGPDCQKTPVKESLAEFRHPQMTE